MILAKMTQNFRLDPHTETESEIKPNKGLNSQIAEVSELNLFRSAGWSLRVSLKKKSMLKLGKTWKPKEKAMMVIARKFSFSFF